MAKKKETAPTTASSSPLLKAYAAIKGVLDEDPMVQIDTASLRETLPHISTGSIVLNYLIGGRKNAYGVAPCPGYPRGKIANIYGKAGAGKTTAALMAAADVCNSGGTCLYLDWEHEVVTSYAKTLGVPVDDPSKFMLAQPDTMEDGLILMTKMAEAGVDLIIVDSVSAAKPREQEKPDVKDIGKQGPIGLQARKWSDFLPMYKKLIARTNTTVIAISQLRANMSPMSMTDTDAQGGNAWKFYSTVRMNLVPVKKEKALVYNALTGKSEEQVVATLVKATLDKCKVSDSNHHSQVLYLTQGRGYDNLRTVVEIAIAHKIIKKGGAWLEWQMPSGEVLRAQGMNQLKNLLKAKDNALNTLFEVTIPKILDSQPDSDETIVEEENDGESSTQDLLDIIEGKNTGAPKSDDDSEEE